MQTKQLKELSELIQNPTESEWLELKSWMDLKEPSVRANIARHIAAISNYGGGYLIFGFNNDGTRCVAQNNVRSSYNIDQIAGIIDRYLQPKFQCDVHYATMQGVEHPIIWVPSHGATPVISKADGPQDEKGKPQGIRSGLVYIRTPKPESVPITTPEQWDKLMQRCVLARRDELIGMFSTIVSGGSLAPSQPKKTDQEELNEWHQALKAAFIAEITFKNVKKPFPLKDNHVQFSYKLIGIGEQRIPPAQLIEVVGRVNNACRDTVRYGWSMFHPFTREGIMPRFMTDQAIDKGQTEFVQASLIEGSQTDALDFWRISMDGRISLIRDFHEDHFSEVPAPRGVSEGEKWFDPWLHIRDLAEVVRHARAMAEEFKNVAQICFQIEWKGLQSRHIASANPLRHFSPRVFQGDHRTVIDCFPLAEVIGNLPAVVSVLYAPVNRMYDPRANTTPEWISQLLPSFVVQGL